MKIKKKKVIAAFLSSFVKLVTICTGSKGQGLNMLLLVMFFLQFFCTLCYTNIFPMAGSSDGGACVLLFLTILIWWGENGSLICLDQMSFICS